MGVLLRAFFNLLLVSEEALDGLGEGLGLKGGIIGELIGELIGLVVALFLYLLILAAGEELGEVGIVIESGEVEVAACFLRLLEA